MDGSRYIALLVVALAIGASLPIITYIISSRTPGRTIPYSTTIDLGSLFEEPLKGGMRSFRNYTELISFLETNIPVLQTGSLIGRISALTSATLGIEGETMGTRQPEFSTQPESTHSTTNVQVMGVDEPDIVKTNGYVIAYARGSKVYLIDPDAMETVSMIEFTDGSVRGLFMVDNYLVLIGTKNVNEIKTYEERLVLSYPGLASTTIIVYDVSDPHSPIQKYNISVNGYLKGARLIDYIGYFVFNTPAYTPSMMYVVPAINGEPVSPDSITVVNPEDLIKEYTTILSLNIVSGEYRVTSFLTGMGTWMYMSHKHLVLTSDGIGGIYYALYKATFTKLIKFLTPIQQVEIVSRIKSKNYQEAMQLLQRYLADRLSSMDRDEREAFINSIKRELINTSFTSNTTIHVFTVDGLRVVYKGNLSAPGIILDQFSIDEYRGRYLVVATTRDIYRPEISYYAYPVSPTYGDGGEIRVVVYNDGESKVKTYSVPAEETPVEREVVYVYLWVSRERIDNVVTIYDLANMTRISQLSGIAEGERIYAARLLGNLFILVTYRRVDPLFTINISDPYHPKIIGFLEIPGFSEYIHPLGNGTIIGIGREGSSLKIGLYNISDPRNIEEISKILLQYGHSPVLPDHHAFTIDPDYARFYIPFKTWTPNREGILAVTYKDYRLDIAKIIILRDALRTAYVDGKLFLFGYNMVKVLDRATLEEVGEINLSNI